MWTTVQHSLLVSYLTSMIPRISTLLHLNYPQKRSRTNPKSIATLAVGMKLNPGLPRINLMRNPMNLGSLLPNLKSTLIRVNTNQGPDMKRSTLLAAFFPSLTPGSLCLGPQLQSWGWMMRKAVKSSDLEVLPLFFHLAQLSRTPLINFNMTLRLLIYPRVNTLSLLHPLLSGTGWDSPVIRTNIRS